MTLSTMQHAVTMAHTQSKGCFLDACMLGRRTKSSMIALLDTLSDVIASLYTAALQSTVAVRYEAVVHAPTYLFGLLAAVIFAILLLQEDGLITVFVIAESQPTTFCGDPLYDDLRHLCVRRILPSPESSKRHQRRLRAARR